MERGRVIPAAVQARQRRFIEAMAQSHARALTDRSDERVQKWQRQTNRIVEMAATIYGEPVALALLDQAVKESEMIAFGVSDDK